MSRMVHRYTTRGAEHRCAGRRLGEVAVQNCLAREVGLAQNEVGGLPIGFRIVESKDPGREAICDIQAPGIIDRQGTWRAQTIRLHYCVYAEPSKPIDGISISSRMQERCEVWPAKYETSVLRVTERRVEADNSANNPIRNIHTAVLINNHAIDIGGELGTTGRPGAGSSVGATKHKGAREVCRCIPSRSDQCLPRPPVSRRLPFPWAMRSLLCGTSLGRSSRTCI